MTPPAIPPRPRRAVLTVVLGAAVVVAAWPAGATSAQGYGLVITPVAHQGQQRLLVHAVERSDPNTATAAGLLPSMLRERAWWLVFDARGQPRCSLSTPAAGVAPARLRAPDSAAQRTALATRLRKACSAWPAGRVEWLSTVPAAAWRWSPEQVCAGARCTAAATLQRSLHGARSLAVVGAGPAPARCVAGRWLVVTNGQTDGRQDGARFASLPPVLRGDIVGYETVRIDGVAVLPGGRPCP